MMIWLALYLVIGAVWAWCLDGERHRNADAITDIDPCSAAFECRWDWLRHLAFWPVYAIGGLCTMLSIVMRGR